MDVGNWTRKVIKQAANWIIYCWSSNAIYSRTCLPNYEQPLFVCHSLFNHLSCLLQSTEVRHCYYIFTILFTHIPIVLHLLQVMSPVSFN